jgi:nucleoid DNA-binding protein
MEKQLFKRISVRTGLSVQEISNIFMTTAALVKEDLVSSGSCTIPYIGRYYVQDSKRRKQKIMNFQTGQQMIATVPPRKQVKFECNKIIKSISNVKFLFENEESNKPIATSKEDGPWEIK